MACESWGFKIPLGLSRELGEKYKGRYLMLSFIYPMIEQMGSKVVVERKFTQFCSVICRCTKCTNGLKKRRKALFV